MVEELPSLELAIDNQFCHVSTELCNRVFFMKVKVHSDELGDFQTKLLYVFGINELIYCNVLVPCSACLSHIIRVNNQGMDNSSGIWLEKILGQMNCEVFIYDREREWDSGDNHLKKICEDLPQTTGYELTLIRTLPGHMWGGKAEEVKWFMVE